MNDKSPTAEIPPAINPSGENAAQSIPEPSGATLRAGEEAYERHIADSQPQRKRGRPATHGKYVGEKRNRGKTQTGEIPVGSMANGSGPLLLAPAQSASVPLGVEEVQPAIDEAVNREFAGLGIELLAFVKNAITRKTIVRETQNKELADIVISKKVIPEEPKKAMITGLVGIAKKYNVNLGNTPEAMFLGGMIAWFTSDSLATRAAIAEYFAMRPGEKALP